MDIADHIVALERSALDRWIRGDPDGYLGLYAPEATYFDPFTEFRLDGRDALERWVAPIRTAALPADPRYDMIHPTAQVDGDVAVLTFNLVNYGRPAGSPAEVVLARWNATEVYRRTGEAWQIIHTHWSFTQQQLAASSTEPRSS